MQRRQFVLATGTAAAAALAGCTSSADEDDDPTGDESDGNPDDVLEGLGEYVEDSRTVRVSASGEVEAEPDLAIVTVGVTAEGDDQGEVRDELETGVDRIESALLEFGIDEDAITTNRFNIRGRRELPPDHPNHRESDERPDYEGSHSLTVEVDDVDDTGAVIDTAVDAGADRVGRIEFTVAEETRRALREEALQDALSTARDEADVIADEIGASVVHAENVDASDGRVSPLRTSYDLAADDAGAAVETAIREDDVTVSASVTVTYEVE